MRYFAMTSLIVVAATTAAAEETRQLDAHEHGVGQLDIAFDGTQIAMELHAPGADIVGFEYAAESSEDRAKIEAALASLKEPLELFVLPEAAQCRVIDARAALETEGAHDDHGDEEHEDHAEDGHDDHEHGTHSKDGHDDHDHDAHAKDEDDPHDHDNHDEDAHEDHGSAQKAGHTEFHAEYLLDCTDPVQEGTISFAYFDTFPNALELEIQVISDRGATAFEVERDEPTLDLGRVF